ncbi:FAD-dependent monooxygenase [Xanthomonas prunicola]|uniref:FAD-binding monooxygenase n=1 Tax=Xanthomonas prunicola TaxID=2053930 RepID=A0A2N3RGN1_9XANT|nr:FAD-dependent monooxygenase [Xanthomonas prunicola]PKV11654.1 FAD-binding monooxygenase [Xanthomonas prunicola]PKV16140.1 FAD-binding monooxygenase [Xanthomonas prunicola]PKV20402.1 FAD-binding monooxygenase [Xanthomonas prunicola]
MTRRVLITGTSVAGTTTAFWLARSGWDVSGVERAPSFRNGGQNVDVRGNAREVLRRMGLEAAALARSTRERGTDWVTDDDRVVARFEAADSSNDSGPTAELEIRRGDIAQIVYDAALEKGANFRFDDTIVRVEQHDGGVQVTFASGRQESYTCVVVAEGVGSHTRELIFPGENRPRWMDMTIAYFSIPQRAHDSAYARQYNAPGGRGAVVKPARDGMLGVHLGIQKRSDNENTWNAAQQRAFIHAQFSGLGWEFPRVIEAMEDVDDIYFDVLRQVRMPRWSNARVVLTGDAAWCPTALSGIGTTLAMVGGYVLAGELAKADTPSAAFSRYEHIMRPFVEEGQNVPKLLPRLLWPHTRPGLAVLRGAMHIASRPLFKKFMTNRFARDSRSIVLPRYE